MTYILLLWINVITKALYTKYQVMDEQDGDIGYNQNDHHWHLWGLIDRLSVGAFCILPMIDTAPPTWEQVLLGATISAALFDICINLLMQKPWNYTGGNKIDKTIGQWKWVIYGALVAISVLLNL